MHLMKTVRFLAGTILRQRSTCNSPELQGPLLIHQPVHCQDLSLRNPFAGGKELQEKTPTSLTTPLVSIGVQLNFRTRCLKTLLFHAPKEVSTALNDLRDLMAFHQWVSVSMGTSLQHLADSLFVHLSNLILLRRDAYLDFVKTEVKQDSMNLFRNAPLFGYGLFPDAAIVTAEQDIHKHESSTVA